MKHVSDGGGLAGGCRGPPCGRGGCRASPGGAPRPEGVGGCHRPLAVRFLDGMGGSGGPAGGARGGGSRCLAVWGGAFPGCAAGPAGISPAAGLFLCCPACFAARHETDETLRGATPDTVLLGPPTRGGADPARAAGLLRGAGAGALRHGDRLRRLSSPSAPGRCAMCWCGALGGRVGGRRRCWWRCYAADYLLPAADDGPGLADGIRPTDLGGARHGVDFPADPPRWVTSLPLIGERAGQGWLGCMDARRPAALIAPLYGTDRAAAVDIGQQARRACCRWRWRWSSPPCSG